MHPCANGISGDRISGWRYTTSLIIQDILHFSSVGSKYLEYIKTLQTGEALYSQAPNMRKNTGPTVCTKIYLYRKCAIISNSLNVGQSFVDSTIRTSYLAWTFYSNSENLNCYLKFKLLFFVYMKDVVFKHKIWNKEVVYTWMRTWEHENYILFKWVNPVRHFLIEILHAYI